MGLTIAFAGKGGVGKTTVSALVIQRLVELGEIPVLAVDADSNANLNEALGVSYAATVGGIREGAMRRATELTGISKQEFLDLQVQEALVEQHGYDLIVMGRPEGPGCYCFANNVLRDVLRKLAGGYRHVVVDSEAGLEHISRRTLLNLDHLMLVSDCTVRGVRTARRLALLAAETDTRAKNVGVVVNRVPDGTLPAALAAEVAASGLPLHAIIPVDENVAVQDADGRPVTGLPPNSPARLAVNSLTDLMVQGAVFCENRRGNLGAQVGDGGSAPVALHHRISEGTQ
jgi:CO dehydrogenase maturation factor